MTSQELRDLLEELELYHGDFARMMGVSERTVSAWCTGKNAVPGGVERYLRLLRSLPTQVQDYELNRVWAEVTATPQRVIHK